MAHTVSVHRLNENHHHDHHHVLLIMTCMQIVTSAYVASRPAYCTTSRSIRLPHDLRYHLLLSSREHVFQTVIFAVHASASTSPTTLLLSVRKWYILKLPSLANTLLQQSIFRTSHYWHETRFCRFLPALHPSIEIILRFLC